MSVALEIALLKRTIILHWNQFIYAEGRKEATTKSASPSPADILIRGAGFLDDAQHVATLHEPARPDRFPRPSARFIQEVEVRRIDAA